MKKYVLGVLFFLGCFFLSVTNNTNLIEAYSTGKATGDEYDSRIITIDLEGLSSRTTSLKVHEVEFCLEGEENCELLTLDVNDDWEDDQVYLRILTTLDYEVDMNEGRSTSIQYTIDSIGDGEKYFYIKPYHGENFASDYVCFFKYAPGTLQQRIVINPDGQGNALHVYENQQYTPVRTISIKVSLQEDEIAEFSDIVRVCEKLLVKEDEYKNNYCNEYSISSDNTFNYYIYSYGDGWKLINIAFDSGSENIEVSKKIYLDTLGPDIELEGGNWIYIEEGNTYNAQKATCKDSVFENDDCHVSNDLDIVTIDYNTDKYQIVTYQASDRLGNIRTTQVKIKVEKAPEKSNTMYIWIGSGSVLLVTGLILGWILIKNNEKKKKISYI